MRYLLLIITLLFSSVAEARYCNNPNCAMCNRIFGPMGGFTAPQPTITYATPATPAPTPLPREVLRELDPSSQSAVNKMLALLAPTPQDTLYDIGSGDGRVLSTASQTYGTPGLGIEINPETADLSRTRLQSAGIDNVTIVTGDATQYDFSGATLITMYLYPQVIKSLVPNLEALRSGTRVISYCHPIPMPSARKIVVGTDTFYLWVKP